MGLPESEHTNGSSSGRRPTSVHHYVLHQRSIHLNLYVLDFAVVFLCFVSQRSSVRPGVAFYWRSKHLQLIGPDQNLPSYLHLPVSTTAQWRKKQTVLHSKCHVNKKLQHSATHRAPTGTSLYTGLVLMGLSPAWMQ